MTAEGVLTARVAGPQHDHAGRIVAAATDRHEHAHAHLGRPLGRDDVAPQPVLLGHGARLLGEHLGADIV